MTISAGSRPRIRVLICDDSGVVRSLIGRMLRLEPEIEIVGSVANGAVAVQMLKEVGADVVVLDVEMPVMDGLTALPLMLRADPAVKVIVASALTSTGAAIALKAIRAGAVDCLHKPHADTREQFAHDVRAKVLAHGRRTGPTGPAPVSTRSPPSIAQQALPRRRPQLVAIGCSTGGPQALFSLFGSLSRRLTQPILLTQHMPPIFTRSLAEHLDRLGHRPCVEAEDGMPLLANRLHVAPGDKHMLVDASGDQLRVKLSDSPPENSCRPSVDPMLRSAVDASRGQVLAVILTGMGRDGVAGARRVVEGGGAVLAQDEASSVVWGMPGAVAREGLCHAVLPLDRLAAKICELAGAA